MPKPLPQATRERHPVLESGKTFYEAALKLSLRSGHEDEDFLQTLLRARVCCDAVVMFWSINEGGETFSKTTQIPLEGFDRLKPIPPSNVEDIWKRCTVRETFVSRDVIIFIPFIALYPCPALLGGKLLVAVKIVPQNRRLASIRYGTQPNDVFPALLQTALATALAAATGNYTGRINLVRLKVGDAGDTGRRWLPALARNFFHPTRRKPSC